MIRILIFVFLLININIMGQNLVPNSSFEDYTYCPQGPGNILFNIEPWTSNIGTVDYYNICGINGYGIPINVGGGGDARTGNAYIGLVVWSGMFTNAREYPYTPLNDTLKAGNKYDVKFYITMMDSMWYAVKNIGIYFSENAPPSDINEILNVEPQVEYSDTLFLTNKEEWLEIKGSFIAQGGEKYITIGNFDDDDKTDTLFIPGGGDSVTVPDPPLWWKHSGYFIDDVSVIMDTTYVGIKETQDIDFSVYPNPAKEKITLELAVGSWQLVTVVFHDLTGGEVLSIPIQSSKNTIDISSLSAGVYTAVLSEKGIPISRRKLIIE